MADDVLLACHTCGKQRNIELDQARQYNKENPYNCFDCSIIPEKPKEEEQSRLSLIETNTDLGQASSPLGNITENKYIHDFQTEHLEDNWWRVCKNCGIVEQSRNQLSCDPNNKLTEPRGIDRYWHIQEGILNNNTNGAPFFTCTNCGHSCFNNGWAGRDRVCQQCRTQNIPPTNQNLFHDPDVNAEIQRTGGIFPQRGTVFRDPIQAQTEYAKQKLEEFRIRKEKLDRQLAREQERIDNYDHGSHGFSIIGLLPIIIMIPVMLLMVTGLTSVLSSSLDCTNMNGNAGIHQTQKNATGLALQCLKQKDSMSFFMGLIPLLIMIPIIILVIRMMII
jgi:hypothetical protein